MNTIQEHIEKAEHNRHFLETVPTSSFPDWAIVVLFYRALHVTSAIIHSNGDNHGMSHAARQKAVERHFTPENAVAYEQLYSRSRLVRYDQLLATRAEYEQLMDRSFMPVLQEAQRKLPGIQ